MTKTFTTTKCKGKNQETYTQKNGRDHRRLKLKNVINSLINRVQELVGMTEIISNLSNHY